MIEENRLWFVRLKEYLLNRYNRAKATADGIGITVYGIFIRSLISSRN
mgnify:CR=1 FL=1